MKCKMLFLVAASVLSLAACGNNNNKNSEVIGHEEDITRYTFEGVHKFDCHETDSYLVKNKVSSYKIVLPNNPSAQIIKAKEELKNLFCEATGVNLEEITEDPSGLVHNKNNEYISLGDTNLLKTSGLTINKDELGVQASRILTLDKSIYLSGGDDVGVIFSVYNFLEVLFNFDVCAYDCVHLDKKDDVKSQIEMYCPRVFETIGYDTTDFYLCWRYIEFRDAFDKMKEIMNIVRNIK